MILTTPNITAARLLPPLRRGKTPPQTLQGNLRFSGDAFEIQNRLKTNPEAAEAARQVAQAAQKAQEEAAFKAIGDIVVWQQGDETLNVAEMVALLCRIRKDEGYPGYGTVETLAKDFPGMDVNALEQGFEKLHQLDYSLGHQRETLRYWLRPSGEEMMKKVYPGINLPSKVDRFTWKKLREHYLAV